MNKSPYSMHWHQKRLRAEKRFVRYGQIALVLALLTLVMLIGSITWRGYSGFWQTQVSLPIHFDSAIVGMEPGQGMDAISHSSYQKFVHETLKKAFPDVTERADLRELYELISNYNGMLLKEALARHPDWLGTTQDVWLLGSSRLDLFMKGAISEDTPEVDRALSDQQVGWIKILKQQGRIHQAFNLRFFTENDSRVPEQAGFFGAMMGSVFTLIVCLLVVFPLGVMTAIYLEEFAKKSRMVDIIEVNINNLAAVPSIVFGLLGLAVYINFMGMPRSASLVGGMTLAMMSLPVIIITTRASLKAIPNTIRDAARALGASPIQVVLHHTLPLAMPGIMTGTILAMARAIGETAPLLMIGMVAFVADTPTGFLSPATVMPVQIYLWAGSPEAGFAEKTAAGILVLLVLLLAMNALAIYLRKRFEVRW